MPNLRFLSLLIAPLCLSAAIPNLPDGVQHVQTLGGIEEYRLIDNGMRVLLMPDAGLPVATVMVTYEVGSRNEATGTTGATHILEHMMFKGTPQFNAERGNDYSTTMERIGARSNATTWFDRTNYFATVPSAYVPLTIELEADRMRNLLIREEDLASEMTVVRNEYERGENSPVQTLIKEIFAAAFVAHPYSHPTIGWESDIENTSPEKLRKFYDLYYWPENAVLTVIGGFDRAAALAAIATHYGAIEKAPHAIPEVTTSEPPQIGPRRVEIHRAGQVGVVMAGYKVPEATHPDWPALILIEQIVGADKTGRLYRALEDKGKASATFAFAPALRDPGLFVFGAYLTPDATHAEVEATLIEELQRLIGGGVTEAELKRAKSVIRADRIYGRDGSYSIAGQINDAIAIGDWTTYITWPEAIEAVTAETIRDVAARYFVDRTRTTGWFIPELKNALAGPTGHPGGPLYFRDPAVFGPNFQNADAAATPETPAPRDTVDFTSRLQQATVAGIDLVAIDLPVESVVSFVGSLAAGDRMSPADHPMLASLTAAMLDKGTLQRDRFAIAETLNELGATLDFGSDAHSLNFSGKFLREDAGAALELLAEQLREPAFDPEVLTSLKNRQKGSLLQAIDNPSYRASSGLARLLYPPEHPNYAEHLEELIADLDRLTAADLAAFHASHYGPASMRLVFAGDIDFEQLKAAVAIAFEGWEGGLRYPTDLPEQLPNAAQEERIPIADKTSVAVHYGYNTGLRRTDPDYLPFMLGNYILGGSFHSRLMQEVRRRQGLTYSIRTAHEGDIMSPGNWMLSASFSPAMLEQGIAATDAVLQDWHENGVSDAEVAAAIETLIGGYLVGLSTTTTVAGQMHSFLQRGYDPGYMDAYPALLRELTAAEVNRAIRQYFDPSALRRVAAGSFQTNAKAPDSNGDYSVAVRLDTPDSAWNIAIESVHTDGEALHVVSRLSRHEAAVAAQVITTVADSVRLKADPELPVKHYILGKSWSWGDNGPYAFIESIEAIQPTLDAAQQIYPK